MRRVMFSVGAVVGMLFFVPFMLHAQSGTTGTQTTGVIKDEQCAPVGTLKENELCKIVDVPCENGKTGTVYSQCKSGKCVATIACGKQLPETPYEIPGSTPTQPNTQQPSTPSVGGIENPIPSAPSPSQGSQGSVPGTSLTPTADGSGREAVLEAEPAPAPAPHTKPITLPGGRTTFPTQSSVGDISSRVDAPDGVYSGGNPFYNGSTFGHGSWGSTGISSANLFSSFFSGLMSFFSGLWGGGGSGAIATTPTASVPSSRTPNQRAEDVLRQFQARPESREAARRAEEERKIIEDILKMGPSSDRTGLPAPGQESLDELLGGSRPAAPVIPPEIIQEEEKSLQGGSGLGPRSENKTGTQVAENGSGAKQNDASPPMPSHPEWWSRSVETSFAAGIEKGLSPFDAQRQAEDEYVDGVVKEIRNGTIKPGSTEANHAHRILEEEVGRTERVRDIEYSTCTICFFKQLDQLIPVTPEAIAVRNAHARLSEFVNAQSIAELGLDAKTLKPMSPYEVRVVIGGGEPLPPGTTFREINLLEYGPIDAARDALNAIRGWWSQPLAAAPVEPRSGFLGGLSAMAERVYDATYAVARRLGFAASVPDISFPAPSSSVPPASPPPSTPLASEPTPPSSPPPAAPNAPPTPETSPAASPSRAPETPPSSPSAPPAQPTPAPSAPHVSSPSSGGFIQGGLSLLGAFLSNIIGFFTSKEEETSPQPSPVQPAPPPSAAITANPSLIDAGEHTMLSWSSVGTLQCVIVDMQLNVIFSDGAGGDVASPALEESTRFGVICDIENGSDKFVNETLVRVRGDESDPQPLFLHHGSVSQSISGTNTSQTSGGSVQTGGQAQTAISEQLGVAPLDVRTCDPDQSINSFIRCLCEAEPNPRGCSIPPGGI